MSCGQFRETVVPVRIGAVCGGSINDAHVWIFYIADSLYGCGIRQTQEGDVGFVNFLFYFRRVFSEVGIDGDELNIISACETL